MQRSDTGHRLSHDKLLIAITCESKRSQHNRFSETVYLER